MKGPHVNSSRNRSEHPGCLHRHFKTHIISTSQRILNKYEKTERILDKFASFQTTGLPEIFKQQSNSPLKKNINPKETYSPNTIIHHQSSPKNQRNQLKISPKKCNRTLNIRIIGEKAFVEKTPACNSPTATILKNQIAQNMNIFSTPQKVKNTGLLIQGNNISSSKSLRTPITERLNSAIQTSTFGHMKTNSDTTQLIIPFNAGITATNMWNKKTKNRIGKRDIKGKPIILNKLNDITREVGVHEQKKQLQKLKHSIEYEERRCFKEKRANGGVWRGLKEGILPCDSSSEDEELIHPPIDAQNMSSKNKLERDKILTKELSIDAQKLSSSPMENINYSKSHLSSHKKSARVLNDKFRQMVSSQRRFKRHMETYVQTEKHTTPWKISHNINRAIAKSQTVTLSNISTGKIEESKSGL